MSEKRSLHAAAQRLLRIKDIGACDAQDFVDVVEACLDEHPADEHEPITREWLDGLPIERTGAGGWMLRFGGRFAISGFDTPGSDIAITSRDSFGRIVDSVWLPQPKTRGEFRRLCAALGVALKEDE